MFDDIFKLLIENRFNVEHQYQNIQKTYIVVIIKNNTAIITFDTFTEEKSYTLLYFSQFKEYIQNFISSSHSHTNLYYLLVIDDIYNDDYSYGIVKTIIVSKDDIFFMMSCLNMINCIENIPNSNNELIDKSRSIKEYSVLNEKYENEIITIIKDKFYRHHKLIATFIQMITTENYIIKEIYNIKEDLRNCNLRKDISTMFADT